jgi:hypothetical protein
VLLFHRNWLLCVLVVSLTSDGVGSQWSCVDQQIFSLDVVVACIMYNSLCINVVTMCKIPTYAKIYNILSKASPA